MDYFVEALICFGLLIIFYLWLHREIPQNKIPENKSELVKYDSQRSEIFMPLLVNDKSVFLTVQKEGFDLISKFKITNENNIVTLITTRHGAQPAILDNNGRIPLFGTLLVLTLNNSHPWTKVNILEKYNDYSFRIFIKRFECGVDAIFRIGLER